MAGTGGRSVGYRPNEHVTYLLRPPEKRPRSGINALAVCESSSPISLYTGGRDGVVRGWDVANPDSARANFNEHVDWVNDVVLVHHGERLLSASSDTTIKVWNPADPSRSLRTLVEHDDYVKALAPLADTAVVSAALDGRVLVWDLTTGKVRWECTEDSSGGASSGGGLGSAGDGVGSGSGSSRSSIYCLAACASTQSSVIIAGSTDRSISVYDARTNGPVVCLRGHSDAIRSLALKHDGSLLLSGSSDATVRLWDLRQQRCIRTFVSHQTDSVWALDAPRDFQTFVSGGRDGTVWHSSLNGDEASLVMAASGANPREGMVLDVKLVPGDQRKVWVSTTGSTVRQYQVPHVDASAPNGTGATSGRQSPRENGADRREASERMEYELAAGRGGAAGGLPAPVVELRGLPAVISYKIMNDRRHVMTLDTSGEVCLWDVTSASLVKAVGKLPEDVSFDDLTEKYNPIVAVPSWFKVDIRLGSVAIRVSRSSASDAEVYAVDADLEVESDETKVNIGDHVIRGLFAFWKQGYENALGNASSGGGDGENTGENEENGGRSAASGISSPRSSLLPPYVFPKETPITLSDDSPVPIMTRAAGEFRGTDEESEALPQWVLSIVRDGKTLTREGGTPKIGFTLFPAEGSDLPRLNTSNLTAPQVLRVRKVAAYVVKELNDCLEEDPQNESPVLETKHLDILCCGKICDPNMNLATVRKFMWQVEASGDLTLAFQMREGDEAAALGSRLIAGKATN